MSRFWSEAGKAGVILATLIAIPGALSFFLPDVSSWMSDNGILGWLLFLLASCVALSFLPTAIRSFSASRAKDYALVIELLDGWDLNSSFFEYLAEHVNHRKLPAERIARPIEERIARWQRDSREIQARNLRRAFKRVREAAELYDAAIFEHMYSKDSGPGSMKDYEYLSVPVEWDLERTDAAFKALEDGRRELVISLRALFKHLHEIKPHVVTAPQLAQG